MSHIVELRIKNTEIKHLLPLSTVISDERAQKIIDQALRASSMDQRNVVAVLTGLMGSGKTWLLSRLFHRPPPELYTSTGVAEQSFRGLLHYIGNIESWDLLSNDDIREILAPFFCAGKSETNVASVAANLIAMEPATGTPLSLPTMKTSTEAAQSSLSVSMKPLSIPEKSSTNKALVRFVKETTDSSKQLMLELVHMIDTGGQPELMEVMPSLVHNANLAVLVLNLMYDLDERPPVNFHMKGIAYKRKTLSQYTGRQLIVKLASTLQAKKSYLKTGTIFRILVVATHRDCIEGGLMARIEALNREVRSLLLPAFKHELVLFETPDKVAFVLNLLNPDDTDKKVLELIRTKINEHALGKVFKTPSAFLILEQFLRECAAYNDRHILSLDECVQIGQTLKMDDEVVKAALVLFHRQNTFLYYRHVLPNHVFLKPQIPFDFVNNIVRFSYQVSDEGLQGVPAMFVSSLKDGIITEEIFCHKELSSLFVPGLYEPQHAIKLFCHTFTIAPLSYEQQPSKTSQKAPLHQLQSSNKEEYLMMCLLPAVSNQELPQYIPSSSDTVPLIIKFSKDCVPLSCFSSTISCLLSTYQWKLSRRGDGTTVCLFHNIVSLFDPSLPVKIVLEDATSHVKVYIDSDDDDRDVLPEVCSQVCQTVFGALEKVFDVMQLSEIDITPAVMCPCNEISEAHFASHFTVMNKNFLRCLKTNSRVGIADAQHMMWLSVNTKMGPSGMEKVSYTHYANIIHDVQVFMKLSHNYTL